MNFFEILGGCPANRWLRVCEISSRLERVLTPYSPRTLSGSVRYLQDHALFFRNRNFFGRWPLVLPRCGPSLNTGNESVAEISSFPFVRKSPPAGPRPFFFPKIFGAGARTAAPNKWSKFEEEIPFGWEAIKVLVRATCWSTFGCGQRAWSRA